MADLKPVLIAGAGPVGLVAAAALVRAGIPVEVLEAGPGISDEMRASTFHAPTLDMLDDLGAAPEMIRQGIIGPRGAVSPAGPEPHRRIPISACWPM